MTQPRDTHARERAMSTRFPNIKEEGAGFAYSAAKGTIPNPYYLQSRHQAIMQKKNYFPLIVYSDHKHLGYTKEHLTNCFLKALKNLDYEGSLEKIDRLVLRRVFCEFSVFVTDLQLSEGYFFATFSFNDNKDDTLEDQKLKILFREFNHSDSEVFAEYQNSINGSSIKDEPSNNKDVKFNPSAFVSWLQRNTHKFRNFNAAETEEYAKFKKTEDDERSSVSNLMTNRPSNLNKSMDDGHLSPRKLSSGVSQNPIKKIFFAKNSHYKDLYNLLEKKKMLQMEYPEINLKKKPEVIKPIIIRNRSPSPMPSGSSNENLSISKKRMKTSTMQDVPQNVGYKLMGAIDSEIKGQIANCFQSFQQENPRTKRLIFDTIKQIHMEKLSEDATSAMQYAKAAQYRLNFAEERNKLKGMEELVILMREQPSALEATRLFEMLYTKDESIKEELKKIHQKKKVKGDAEYKVKMMMRDRKVNI